MRGTTVIGARVGITLACAGLLSIGCKDEGRDADSQGLRCATDCESQVWPAVLVASDLPVDAGLRIDVQGASGRAYDVQPRAGCPGFHGSFACAQSFWVFGGSPDDESVELHAELGGTSATTTVLLKADGCGHDLGYVRVSNQAGTLAIADAHYISPCALPEL